MKSKTVIGLLIVSMCLFALCIENQEQTAPATTTTQARIAPPTTIAADIPLDPMQIEACNSADAGGTCQTKLKEFEIVPLEDCCKYLNKCC